MSRSNNQQHWNQQDENQWWSWRGGTGRVQTGPTASTPQHPAEWYASAQCSVEESAARLQGRCFAAGPTRQRFAASQPAGRRAQRGPLMVTGSADPHRPGFPLPCEHCKVFEPAQKFASRICAGVSCVIMCHDRSLVLSSVLGIQRLGSLHTVPASA
jgi:hypothetical protein